MGEITQGKEKVEKLVRTVYGEAADGMAKQILKFGIAEKESQYYFFLY